MTEATISCSEGPVAEWHDGRIYTPNNADRSLKGANEHWVGDPCKDDRAKVNEVFEPAVKEYNARQTRADRKIGEESSNPDRQKTYYDGIVDGTFAFGTLRGDKDTREKPVYEIVIQIGDHDSNGVTDDSFDNDEWTRLKKEKGLEAASAYVQKHRNTSDSVAKSKRILHRTVERLCNLDPEHLIVLRADFHGDEPNGTPHAHVAFCFRATGYTTGMESRIASVRALKQMGFAPSKEKGYGIEQLHAHIRDIIEEEMLHDGIEHGYEPIRRNVKGEKRERIETRAYKDLKEKESKLDSRSASLDERERSIEHAEKAANDHAEIVKHKAKQDAKRTTDNADAEAQKIIAAARKEATRIAREAELERERLMQSGQEAIAKEQERLEKEFQHKEDALDTQREAIKQREAAVAQREKEQQELIALGRRKDVGRKFDSIGSEGTTVHPERPLPDISGIE